MQLKLVGRKVTFLSDKVIGFSRDDAYDTLTCNVDTTSDWNYVLDVVGKPSGCGTAFGNVINLTRVGNDVSVTFDNGMLPEGKVSIQFRGSNGTSTYVSEIVDIWCKKSLSYSEIYNIVPSEFTQIEERIQEYNNHPPYPDSASGHWMIWNVNTHQYEESNIPIGAQLPTIDETTTGKYLTNNGTNAQWVSIAVLPAVSSATNNKILSNNGTIPIWIDNITSFNDLSNPPKYNGANMTSATNIPEVKTATWDSKQEALVSGTNIKTINSQSVLGEGNIQIDGVTDFEDLDNRPKYNGAVMTGSTDVPQVKTAVWDAKYDKPATGIPKTDLSQSVQSSLDKADTALQTAPVTSVNSKTGAVVLTQDDVADGTTYKRTHNDFTDTYKGKITTNESNISTIEGKIPSAASTSNQLADKAWVEAKGYITEADIPVTDVTINGTSKLDGTVAKIVYETGLGSDSTNTATVTAIRAFVNSSIEAVAAYYITADASGNAFATKAALDAGPWYYAGATRTPTRNDYAIVIADETHSGQTARYTYTSNQWAFQYTFNMSFTQAQINAINSGIDATKVGTYDAHVANTSNPHSVTKAQVGLGNVGNFKAVSTEASQGLNDTEKSNARANIGAGTSSFSGSYNDLDDKPTIPEIEDFTAAEINALWEAN